MKKGKKWTIRVRLWDKKYKKNDFDSLIW
jgi:hypothetical protein